MSSIKARVKEIQEVRVISEKFSVQTIIVETQEQYPQVLPLEFTNDSIKQAEQLNVGDTTDFNININGREWTAPDGVVKYFVTLNCWSFAPLGSVGSKPISNIDRQFLEAEIQEQVDENEDDFPF